MKKQAELAGAIHAVGAILKAPDWVDVEVKRVGHLWQIGGEFRPNCQTRGSHHGTSDEIATAGAMRLDLIARSSILLEPEKASHAQAPDLSPPDVGGVVSPSDRSVAGGVEGGGATLYPTGQPIGSDVVPLVAPKPDYSNWTDGYVKPEATLSDAETDALKARVKELEDALAAKDAAVSEIDEPMPDALAVLVPQDQRGRERDFLMARWIELNAYIMDSALPVSQRKLPDMTAAQRAEFDQLNTYKSWFN
jgi:hypothetical protein